MLVMFRGHFLMEVLGADWTQNSAGVAQFVHRLEDIMRRKLGPDVALPRIIFSDRGPGMYQTSTGHITREYHKALCDTGFRAYAGTDASQQPADQPDVYPHETVAAWIRYFQKRHPVPKHDDLDVMEESFRDQCRECMDWINSKYNVEGIHQAFPERIQELIDAEGERLPH